MLKVWYGTILLGVNNMVFISSFDTFPKNARLVSLGFLIKLFSLFCVCVGLPVLVAVLCIVTNF